MTFNLKNVISNISLSSITTKMILEIGNTLSNPKYHANTSSFYLSAAQIGGVGTSSFLLMLLAAAVFGACFRCLAVIRRRRSVKTPLEEAAEVLEALDLEGGEE